MSRRQTANELRRPCTRRARSHRLGLALALAACLAAPTSGQLTTQSAASLQQREAGATLLVPGVLVDRTSETVVLMSPTGEVEAIGAADGLVLWSSPDAAKPIGLFGNYVVAQRETSELEVAFLDLARGTLRDDLEITLPQGVFARVDDAFDRSFEVRALRRGTSPLVTWTETEKYVRGVPPEPGEPTQWALSQAHLVDTASMIATEVPLAQASEARTPLPSTVTDWSARTAGALQPFDGDGVLAVVVHGSRRDEITLKRWDANGRPLDETSIHRGAFVVSEPSLDGRHFAVVETSGSGYRWTVFETATARSTGTFETSHSFAPFVAIDDAVIFPLEARRQRTSEGWTSQPRRVVARSLATGTLLWERPLRETRFTGMLPP